MKDNLKKPLLFVIIVVIGSVFVIVNIPLIILLPLLLLVGFVTLMALGSITITEIREGIAGLGKTGILKRLNDIKFFEKQTADIKKVTPPVPEREIRKETKNESDAKPGLKAHISTFFSSIGSLGSLLRHKSRQGKKVEEINKLLDKTVSEKVSTPPPAGTAPAGGAGTGSLKKPDLDDPFMSLSGDEFDEGLLEGLGDEEGSTAPPPGPVEEPAFNPADFPDLEPAGPDLPAPANDIRPSGGDIPQDAGNGTGGGLEEFSGLDGGDLSDADFGDLDSLSLDDIGPDADVGGTPDAASTAPAESPGTGTQPAPAASAASDSNAVKTAWIPSDAPKNANETEDDISTQADMAAFAGGSGGDEDLLSSIASDVKHTKKEQDLSLLRDLKDFRAPAAEIEQELGGMYERMSLPQQTKKKEPPATKGIK